jgi:hypothetical protein
LSAGKRRAAVKDLDAVGSALSGEEGDACQFVRALANLEVGRTRTAVKILGKVEVRGKWLGLNKYAKALLLAYVDYRIGTPRSLAKASRALLPLTRTDSDVTSKAKALLGAVYEATGYRYAVAGRRWQARRVLLKARRYLPAKRRDVVSHNLLVLRMGRGANKGVAAALRKLGASPPEALVNRGILADRRGDYATAAKLWKTARARGVRNRSLSRWLRIKKELRGL